MEFKGTKGEWVRIESRDDLPNVTCDVFWFDKEKGVIVGKYFTTIDKETIDFLLSNATHYQLIVKPQPPIY